MLFLSLLLNSKFVNAEIYQEIKVEGNQRLSVETVLMFSGLNINQEVSDDDLNISIKNLYNTNYFKDIKITSQNNILTIAIIENPIIQSIKINGVKNKTILNELSKITKKSEKYPYLKKKSNHKKIFC